MGKPAPAAHGSDWQQRFGDVRAEAQQALLARAAGLIFAHWPGATHIDVLMERDGPLLCDFVGVALPDDDDDLPSEQRQIMDEVKDVLVLLADVGFFNLTNRYFRVPLNGTGHLDRKRMADWSADLRADGLEIGAIESANDLEPPFRRI